MSAIRQRLREALGRPAQRAKRGPLEGMRASFPKSLLDLEDSYEADVVAAVERLAKPGFVCADLGAHFGYYTLLMANLTGAHGSVLAFEAAPDNATLIEDTVALNRLDDVVQVEVAAVSDTSSEGVQLFAGAAGGSMEWSVSADFASRASSAEPATPGPMVRSVALDDYFVPGAQLDLIKMDIEGAEGLAIAGMARLLDEARPTIVLEYHRDDGWPVVPRLQAAGYTFSELSGAPAGPFKTSAEVPYQFVAHPPVR